MQTNCELACFNGLIDGTNLFLFTFAFCILGLICSSIPDDHFPGAILSCRDDTLEFPVFKRMIFHMNSQMLISRIHGRTFWHRPRYQHTVSLQSKVKVQAASG